MKHVWRAGTGRVVLAPVGVASAWVGLFALVYWATVRTEPGRVFGDASLRGAIRTHSDLADGVDRVLGLVSAASLAAGVAAIAIIALVRLARVAGLCAVGVVIAANGSTWLLKNYLLPRPDLGLSEVSPATQNSLPSGHTTAVFSIVLALLLVVPVGWRAAIAVAGGLGGVLVAVATMSAGWHRAGDSVAAFFVVGTWTAVAVTIIVVRDAGDRRTREPRHLPGSARLLGATAAALAVGVVLAVLLVLVGSLRHSAVGPAFAFLAGGLFIVVAAVAVLVATLALVPPAARPATSTGPGHRSGPPIASGAAVTERRREEQR